MKKSPIFLIFCGLLSVYTANAQDTIPNPGFEDWTNAGTYEDPDGWFTPNQGTSLAGVVTVEKTTDAHSGTYAIRLETKNVITETIPGTAVAGVLNPFTLEIDPGFAVPGNPISLEGWYKYLPYLLDAGSVEVLLSKWNPTLKVREPVGSGIFVQPMTITSYTSFSINIIYTSSDTADTAIITLLSGSYTNPPGSVLFVDDLSFTFPPPPPVGIENIDESTEVSVYPNPATNEIIIATPAQTSAFIELRDLNGRLILKAKVSGKETPLNLRDLTRGLYTYLVVAETGGYLRRGTLIIN